MLSESQDSSCPLINASNSYFSERFLNVCILIWQSGGKKLRELLQNGVEVSCFCAGKQKLLAGKSHWQDKAQGFAGTSVTSNKQTSTVY